MRKFRFYFLSLAAAGMLFATSCVDNTESDSVNKIREAKATELKGLADLYKAQGDAAKLTAEAQKLAAEAQKLLADNDKLRAEGEKAQAEATAKKIEAEATYQEALAAYKNAETDDLKARTQIAKDSAAHALLVAQEDLARIKKLNEARIKEYEKRLKQAEYDLLKIELEMELKLIDLAKQKKLAQAKADAEVADTLNFLLGKYTSELDNLITAQRNLATKNNQLIVTKQKVELAKYDSAKLVKTYLDDLNGEIATATAKIAKNLELIARWEQYQPADTALIAAVEQDLDAAAVELKDAYDAYLLAQETYATALEAQTAAQQNRDEFVNVTSYYGYYRYRDINDGSSPYWDTGYETLDASGIDVDGRYHYVGDNSAIGQNIYAQTFNGYYYYWAILEYTSSIYYEGNYSSKEDLEHEIAVQEQDKTDANKAYVDSAAKLTEATATLKTQGQAERTAYANAKEKEADKIAKEKAMNNALDVYNKLVSEGKPANQKAYSDARKAYEGLDSIGRALDPATGKLYNEFNAVRLSFVADSTWYDARAKYDATDIYITNLVPQVIDAKNYLNNITSYVEYLNEQLGLLTGSTRADLELALENAKKVTNAATAALYAAETDHSVALAAVRAQESLLIALQTNLYADINLNDAGEIIYPDLIDLIEGNADTIFARQATTVQSKIDRLLADNITSQQTIDNKTHILDNYADYIVDNSYDYKNLYADVVNGYKTTIANLEKDIAKITAELPVLQKLVDTYKAAIDSINQ